MNLRIGILTSSDRSSRGERPDLSGPALAEQITGQGWTVARTLVLPDDLNALTETLSSWADSDDLDIILTTGGTGFGPRDVMPEATRAVITREAPGLAEAMRQQSLKIHPACDVITGSGGHTRKDTDCELTGKPQRGGRKFTGGPARPAPCGGIHARQA